MGEVADILERIVDQRRERLADHLGPPLRAGTNDSRAVDRAQSPLLRALAERSGKAIIAEVKMGSPRLGSLVGRVDPARQARSYRAAGAAALSVVVEPDFFHGSYELLEECKAASGLPALAKDFVVSPLQIEWARAAGADALLLIAALYSADELRSWAAAIRAAGMAPLIETHSVADLAKLDGAEWELVGVNNRDLRTFEVDLAHSIGLLPSLPGGALRVAESGIGGGADRRRLAEAGFDAFLIGEALLLAEDPGVKLRELLG
jgi:indole-3-glycerol phosphate synthase